MSEISLTKVTDLEINRSTLIFQLHPDLHQHIEDASSELNKKDSNSTDDWTDQFKALNEAYSVLSKPESKRIYDLSQPGERNRNEDRRKYA